MSIQPVSYLIPQNGKTYLAQFDGSFLRVELGTSEVLIANVEMMGDEARVRLNPFVMHEQLDQILAIGMEHLFSHFPNLKQLRVVSTQRFDHEPTFAKFVAREAAGSAGSGFEISIERSLFYQNPLLWHRKGLANAELKDFPERPVMPVATHYRRYVPKIGKTVSFRTIEIERDLARFHDWHNQPRVYDLWDLHKSVEDLRTYLEQGLKDPHQVSMIMEFDGVPVGYFEVYWAKEDRLGPYYESENYDRGFHFLIGEAQYLGADNTDSALRSIMHFMYLEDQRTKRLVAEPRADNKRVLKYVQIVPNGWEIVKEFDFPHKRAALLMSHRERFFSGGAL